jgi:hypothetical protein
VVLAQRTPRVLQGAELDLACDQVQARWDLNTTRWAKVFVPARDAEAGSKTAKAKSAASAGAHRMIAKPE